jgi:hypothetical protein
MDVLYPYVVDVTGKYGFACETKSVSKRHASGTHLCVTRIAFCECVSSHIILMNHRLDLRLKFSLQIINHIFHRYDTEVLGLLRKKEANKYDVNTHIITRTDESPEPGSTVDILTRLRARQPRQNDGNTRMAGKVVSFTRHISVIRLRAGRPCL